MKKILFFSLILMLSGCSTIAYLNVSVPEEGGIRFDKITDETVDVLVSPLIQKSGANLSWLGSPLLALSPDNTHIAYLVFKNKQHNIMVRPVTHSGASIQRTFRTLVNDVAWSPDGKSICFSEVSPNRSTIYMTDAMQGTVLRQISSGNSNDCAPAFSPNSSKLFFSKFDGNFYSVWSYDFKTSQFSNYSVGIQPYPMDEHSFLCVRNNTNGVSEIWRVNYSTGQESIILSGTDGQSFSSPQLSPDGKWVLCVGNSKATTNNAVNNLDLYVVSINGTNFTQLTYHQGHDMSPVWSKDGKEIFFLSQRGTEKGEWNIWRMTFPLYGE